MNRLPSLPAGKARVSFGTTTKGASKVILDIPTWLQSIDNYGKPRTLTKYKKLQTSNSDIVSRFQNALERGWFFEEADRQGNKVTIMDLSNISYFDNYFQTKEGNWVNFSELVTADISEVLDPSDV